MKKKHIFQIMKVHLASLFIPEIEKRGNQIFSWQITILIQKEFYGPEFDSSGNKVGKKSSNPTSARFIMCKPVDI